jgi:hypothetical protein
MELSRSQTIALNKDFARLSFQDGLCLVNLNERYGINITIRNWLSLVGENGQTGRYRWELRKVDQLRNLYVYEK